jgi:uncharacterized protein involved in exopolysaccharide biosynthesis
LPSGGSHNNGFAYLQIAESRQLLEHLLKAPADPDSTRATWQLLTKETTPTPEDWDELLHKLRKVITVEYEAKSSILWIKTRHRDKNVATHIANQLVKELRRFDSDVLLTRARYSLQFVSNRLAETKDALSLSESRLAEFRESNARIGNAPRLRLAEERLLRDLRLKEELYGLLSREYENARIQERRDAPVFSVVDPAVPPARPEGFPWPVAAVVAMVGTFLSMRTLGALRDRAA